MKNNSKGMFKRSVGLLVILAMMCTMLLSTGSLTSSAAPSEMTFVNISDDGENKISMSNERTFEVTVPLAEGTDAQALIENLSWDLSREKGMFDETEFPYQYLGGSLDSWTVYNSEDPLFTILSTEATDVDGMPAIQMTMQNALLFGRTVVQNNRNNILDYTGDYTLSCKAGDGTVLGTTTVRVNPYDSYRTTSEFSEELVEAASYANSRTDMYAEVRSMGQSTNGLDMPYIIIADSKDTLDQWQDLLNEAKEDPASVIEQIKNGMDYKIPILYSNVHADETSGADAPMNFIWDIVTSDQTDNKVPYNTLTGMTEEGEAQIAKEREEKNIHTSSLIEDWVTNLGAITAGNQNSGVVDLKTYYNVEEKTLDVDAILDDVFFIVVPEENVDGRTHNTRTAGGGVDLNRDNLFQTQKETQNMTAMIAEWNPVAFMEFHGFVSGFQVEPCSPPHEPNIEYDLFAEMALKGGEAFGAAAVANNDMYNSYVMPLRDYLTEDENGTPYWAEPWDDMSTNYTPQYSLLHGTIAYTVEVPGANEDGTKALEYGMLGHTQFMADNKETCLLNLIEGFKRGVENEDPDSVRDWYVDAYDNVGAEADVYRPRSEENNNFFPEYYVIPVDVENQRNLAAAYEMEEFLIRNGVILSKLTEDVTVNGETYQAGSFVVDMHQAKRNIANATLYSGVLITGWPDLYSEPITAFDKTRGFDCAEIRVADAFAGKLATVAEAEGGATVYTGDKGDAVILPNNSVQAIAAVNTLLDAGKTVGYVTEGEYKGDFAISYADFLTVKDEFILTAYGVKESPKAQSINKPTVYIIGKPAQATTGYIDYNEKRDNTYNFNRIAFIEQMGFTVTTDVSKADVIVGNKACQSYEQEAVYAAIQSGTPLVYFGGLSRSNTLLKDILPEEIRDSLAYTTTNGNYDALTTVEYLSDSMVTYSYKADGDNIMYGFGGNYFTSLPEGAVALIKTSTEDPMEGFFPQSALDGFKGQITAFEYQQNGLDVTAFANTLTNKAHQQDDYRYATNAIYNKMLGDEVVIPVDNEEPSSSSETDPDSSSEVPSSSETSSSDSSTDTPDTGDAFPLVAVLLVAVSGVAVLFFQRRKRAE